MSGASNGERGAGVVGGGDGGECDGDDGEGGAVSWEKSLCGEEVQEREFREDGVREESGESGERESDVRLSRPFIGLFICQEDEVCGF